MATQRRWKNGSIPSIGRSGQYVCWILIEPPTMIISILALSLPSPLTSSTSTYWIIDAKVPKSWWNKSDSQPLGNNSPASQSFFAWDLFCAVCPKFSKSRIFVLTIKFIFYRALLSNNPKTQVRCVAPLQCDDGGNKLVIPPAEVGSEKRILAKK